MSFPLGECEGFSAAAVRFFLRFPSGKIHEIRRSERSISVAVYSFERYNEYTKETAELTLLRIAEGRPYDVHVRLRAFGRRTAAGAMPSDGCEKYIHFKGGRNMMKRKGFRLTALLLAMMLAVFGLAACGTETQSGTGGSQASGSSVDEPLSVEEETETKSQDPEDSQSPEQETYEVALTYVNEQYIAEGDESLEKMITDVDGTVQAPAGEEGLAEACKNTIELLRTVPDGRTDLTTVIDDRFQINSVTVGEDGTATVDLASVPENGMDNYSEQFFIYQITGSLVNSFEEVTGVTFTVGGQTVETIGGHLDASARYTVSDLDNFNAPGVTDTAEE